MKGQKVGKKGEGVACNYLKENGFVVLERNHKSKHSEIDVIARKKDVLHFVEVRSTATEFFGTPEETVKKEKIERMERAALAYITFNNLKTDYQIDVICVVFLKDGSLKEVDYYENITL
jgi:putative endonuclease